MKLDAQLILSIYGNIALLFSMFLAGNRRKFPLS